MSNAAWPADAATGQHAGHAAARRATHPGRFVLKQKHLARLYARAESTEAAACRADEGGDQRRQVLFARAVKRLWERIADIEARSENRPPSGTASMTYLAPEQLTALVLFRAGEFVTATGTYLDVDIARRRAADINTLMDGIDTWAAALPQPMLATLAGRTVRA